MEMTNFIKLEDEIKQILIDDPETRNDDMILYVKYIDFKSKNIAEVLYKYILSDKEYRRSFGIKSFGAVERCRRKIQASCPWLESNRTKIAREQEEIEYKEYSKL